MARQKGIIKLKNNLPENSVHPLFPVFGKGTKHSMSGRKVCTMRCRSSEFQEHHTHGTSIDQNGSSERNQWNSAPGRDGTVQNGETSLEEQSATGLMHSRRNLQASEAVKFLLIRFRKKFK